MIKVCHFTSVHPRYDIRVFRKECVSLVNAGYDVTLVVNDELDNETCQGVKIISTGYKAKSRIDRIVHSGAKVFELAKKVDADIYCFHDPELLRFAKKLKKQGKKVIFDSHEFYALQILTKEYIPVYLRRIISKVYQMIERHSLKYVDAVLTPCTIDGRNYFEGKAEQTVFISNVPRSEDLAVDESCSVEKKDIVCYTGSLSYERGIFHLIKAVAKTNAKLVLAGKYSSDEFKKTVESLNEYKAVDYRGYLDKHEIAKLYQSAKIGVSTLLDVGQYSHIDTMATKVYEYMALGIPVIISDTPYIRSVLGMYRFGIAVKPDDTDSIANAIEYLLNNPDVASKMGHEGRKAVSEKYSWEIEERILLNLYNQLWR